MGNFDLEIPIRIVLHGDTFWLMDWMLDDITRDLVGIKIVYNRVVYMMHGDFEHGTYKSLVEQCLERLEK